MGNLMADLCYCYRDDIDVALVASGNMRINCVIRPGYFTAKTLSQVFPDDSTTKLISLPGYILKEALENSVS
jgi:hypothetical protein